MFFNSRFENLTYLAFIFFPLHYVTLPCPEAVLAYTCENIAQYSFPLLQINSLITPSSIGFARWNEISFLRSERKNPRGKDYLRSFAKKDLCSQTSEPVVKQSIRDDFYKIRNARYSPCRRTSRWRYARARKQFRDVHQKIRKCELWSCSSG